MTEQTIAEISAAIEQEIEADEASLVGMLADYCSARATEADGKFVKEKLGALFKNFLERHPDQVLFDGEHEITARLQSRALPGRGCDLNAVYDGARPLFEQLLRNGCLKVDMTAIKTAGALVGGIEHYLAPAGTTTALIVEEKR